MFSFTYEEILAIIKEKYIYFKKDQGKGVFVKNGKKREIEIMRDLMPIYRENILENEGLEPFSLNQYEIREKLRRDATKQNNEEFEFYNQYLDLVDEINYLQQYKKMTKQNELENEKEPSPKTKKKQQKLEQEKKVMEEHQKRLVKFQQKKKIKAQVRRQERTKELIMMGTHLLNNNYGNSIKGAINKLKEQEKEEEIQKEQRLNFERHTSKTNSQRSKSSVDLIKQIPQYNFEFKEKLERLMKD